MRSVVGRNGTEDEGTAADRRLWPATAVTPMALWEAGGDKIEFLRLPTSTSHVEPDDDSTKHGKLFVSLGILYISFLQKQNDVPCGREFL